MQRPVIRYKLSRTLFLTCRHERSSFPVALKCLNELFPFEGFQFLQCSRPVFSKKPGQATVCQYLASGLTMSAVVRLVICIANTLHRLAASWAGLSEASMHRHVLPKGCDLFREVLICF